MNSVPPDLLELVRADLAILDRRRRLSAGLILGLSLALLELLPLFFVELKVPASFWATQAALLGLGGLALALALGLRFPPLGVVRGFVAVGLIGLGALLASSPVAVGPWGLALCGGASVMLLLVVLLSSRRLLRRAAPSGLLVGLFASAYACATSRIIALEAGSLPLAQVGPLWLAPLLGWALWRRLMPRQVLVELT